MTTARASCRCPVGIHSLDLSASLFRFVNHDGYELRPTGIMNTLRQVMVLDHPFDIQIFEFDDPIFLGKLVRLFERFSCKKQAVCDQGWGMRRYT
jgi:hypothetical protein